MQPHHSHITSAIAIAAIGLALGGAQSASAQPPTTEIISSTWIAGPAPTAPPYRGTGNGTFDADGVVSDSGNISIQGQDAAVASPIVGILLTDETLTSQDGSLKLRCVQTARDFTDLSAVPSAGQCAITDRTGTYAALHGHGTITSVANLITRTETDTIVLKVA
jgi:hypothetical protein